MDISIVANVIFTKYISSTLKSLHLPVIFSYFHVSVHVFYFTFSSKNFNKKNTKQTYQGSYYMFSIISSNNIICVYEIPEEE